MAEWPPGGLGEGAHHIACLTASGIKSGSEGCPLPGWEKVGAASRLRRPGRKLQGVVAARHGRSGHGRIVSIENACKYGQCMVVTNRFGARSGGMMGRGLGGVGRASF
jgi:hypothetical protein